MADRYSLPSPEYFAGLSDEKLNDEVTGGNYFNFLSTVVFAGGCTLIAADTLPSFVEGAVTGNPVEIAYSFASFGVSTAMIVTGKNGIERTGLRVRLARMQRTIRRESGFSREAIE